MNSLLKQFKKEKLWVGLAAVIWLFLFLTTISKTYSFFHRHNMEFELGYIFLRAFLIWGVIAFFVPLFIYLAKIFPIDRNSYRNIAFHILFALLFVPLHAGIFRASMMLIYSEIKVDWASFWASIPVIMTWLGIIGPLSYGLIITAYYFKKYYDRYRERQLRSTRMEAELASIQLHILKVQLHPHFLFNTIHNIHALIHEEPDKAKRVLHLLKRFLKISIHRVDDQQVPLAKELEFTGIYLEIEKIRFSNRLTIQKEIDEDTLDALVPSFLLQPLVENAVKHGISKKMQSGVIRISSSIEKKLLRLKIEDNGPGLEGGLYTHGVGLENTKQRLNQLYANARFDLLESPLGGLKVMIEIPLKKAEPQEVKL